MFCMFTGPGPAYNLPSLTGYIGHDPSRRREPAYSMKFLKKTSHYADGPGPKYNVAGLTNHGPLPKKAYTMGMKKSSQSIYISCLLICRTVF